MRAPGDLRHALEHVLDVGVLVRPQVVPDLRRRRHEEVALDARPGDAHLVDDPLDHRVESATPGAGGIVHLEAESEALASAPLIALASSTAIAWAPILEALVEAAGVRRVVATVLSSASSWMLGRVTPGP